MANPNNNQRIGANQIRNQAITEVKLADGSVSTSKLQNLSVTSVKLANNSVTYEKLATEAVRYDNLHYNTGLIYVTNYTYGSDPTLKFDSTKLSIYDKYNGIELFNVSENGDVTILAGNINLSDDTKYYQFAGYNILHALKLNDFGANYSTLNVGINAGTGLNSSYAYLTNIGYAAGKDALGDYITSAGYMSNHYNGQQSAFKATTGQTSLGALSGFGAATEYGVNIGFYSGYYSIGKETVNIGKYSGYNHQSDYSILIGSNAGYNTSGNNIIALGYEAAKDISDSDLFIIHQNNISPRPLIYGDLNAGTIGLNTNTARYSLDIYNSNSSEIFLEGHGTGYTNSDIIHYSGDSKVRGGGSYWYATDSDYTWYWGVTYPNQRFGINVKAITSTLDRATADQGKSVFEIHPDRQNSYIRTRYFYVDPTDADETGSVNFFVRARQYGSSIHIDSGDGVDSKWSNLYFKDYNIVKWHLLKETDDTFSIRNENDERIIRIYQNGDIKFNPATTGGERVYIYSYSDAPLRLISKDSWTGITFDDPDNSSNLYYKGSSDTFQFESDLKLHSESTIRSSNFASGWSGSGIRIDYDITTSGLGTIELDDLFVRGQLNAYELLIHKLRAVEGGIVISSARGKVAIISGSDYTIEDADNDGITSFAVDDIVLVQKVSLDGSTITKRVVRKVTAVSGLIVTLGTLSDAPADNGSIEVGDTLVQIGNTTDTSRQGSIYITAHDSGSPFIRIMDDVDSWTAWISYNKIKAQLGNLSGYTFNGKSLSGYGLVSENAYLSGEIGVESLSKMPGNEHLIVHYRFIESSEVFDNDIFLDINGSGNNATAFVDGTMQILDSPLGNVAKFDGGVTAGDYFSMDNPITLNLTNSSIAFWAKLDVLDSPDTTNTVDAFRIFSSDVAYKFLDLRTQQDSSGTFYLFGETDVNSDVYVGLDTNITADTEWHHWVLVLDGIYTSVYCDGKYIGQYTMSLPGSSSTVTFKDIGKGAGSEQSTYGCYWKGGLTDIRFYDRQINESEIKALFTNGAHTESTYIRGNEITTGYIISNNWSSSEGSKYDLLSGTFYLGGSLNPKLSWDGTNLSIEGTVTITSGSGISNLSDAGNLATKDTADFNSDVSNKPQNIYNQLLDPSTWIVGTSGSQTGFSQNGTTSENSIIIGTDPFSQQSPLWECIPDSNSDADGGWITDKISISSSKTYRFSVYVKRTGSLDGTTYLGVYAYDSTDTQIGVLKTDGSSDTNAYFYVGDPPELDKWYLLVGYLYANEVDISTISSVSGIYDIQTGEKVANANHFKLQSETTKIRHRAYLYYCTDTNTRQYFYLPRIDVINGSEPSIEELLNNPELVKGSRNANKGLDNSGSLITKVLPGENIGTPSGAGLFLGADYLGYYDNSQWKVYIDNSGLFTFKGDDNNYISWDGSQLNLVGTMEISNPFLMPDDSKLISYYDFNEGNGEYVYDKSGTSLDFKEVYSENVRLHWTSGSQEPYWKDYGVSGRSTYHDAFSFDQHWSSDYSDNFGQLGNFVTDNSPISVFLWVKPTSTDAPSNWRAIPIMWENYENSGFRMGWTWTDMYPAVWTTQSGGTGEIIASSNGLNLNQWNHLGFVYDGANCHIYLNGEKIISGAMTYIAGTVDMLLQLGTNFQGELSEFRTYTYALSREEVQGLYAQRGKAQTTLITGEQITTGSIVSSNWDSFNGSKYDLLNGEFYLGGSADPKLSWDNNTLTIRGQVFIENSYVSPDNSKLELHYNFAGIELTEVENVSYKNRNIDLTLDINGTKEASVEVVSDGKSDAAYNFVKDANNDYTLYKNDVNMADYFPTDNYPFTLSVVFNIRELNEGNHNYDNVIFSWGSYQNWGYRFGIQWDGAIEIWSSQEGSSGSSARVTSASGIVDINKEHHIVLSYDGTTLIMYLNGSEVHRGDFIYKTSDGTNIGSIHMGHYNYDGTISDFKLYSYACSYEEVMGLFNASGKEASTIIRGAQITTGSIKSTNWSYFDDNNFTGSKFDLDGGKLWTSDGIFSGIISGAIKTSNNTNRIEITKNNTIDFYIDDGNSSQLAFKLSGVYDNEINSFVFEIQDYLLGPSDNAILKVIHDPTLNNDPNVTISSARVDGSFHIAGSTTAADISSNSWIKCYSYFSVGEGNDLANTYIRVQSEDSYESRIEAYGSNQGTGRLYVGQSSTYGGGIIYNGDNNPDIFSTTDAVSFYRRDNGADIEVFYYSYNSNYVHFKGKIIQDGSASGISIYQSSDTFGRGLRLYQNLNSSNYYDLLHSDVNDDLRIGYNDSAIFSLDSSGKLQVTDDVVGFQNLSDMRLKTDITALNYEKALNAIMSLNPVEFNWNNKVPKSKIGHKDSGFIAQDLVNLIPEVVGKSNLLGQEEFLYIKYDKLMPYVISVIQKQQNEIKKLKEKLYGHAN